MSTSEAYRIPHIKELDGVRGLAALLVFFHHVGYVSPQQPGWPQYVRVLSWIAECGSRGVDLFFVLSGFLITSILIQERGSTRYYQDFYWKRALRIIPLYFVTLLFVLLFLHELGYVALAAVFLVNFAMVLHVQGVGPFWTLAIEEQFYLVWPTIVRRRTVPQLRRWTIALGLGAVGLRLLLALRGHDNYYVTPLRCDGLAFGALLACHFQTAGNNRKLRRSWDWYLVGLTLLGLCLAFSENLPLSPAMQNALIQTGTVLITGPLIGLIISRTGSRWTGFLRSRVLVFFGLISYAFYMVHLYLVMAWDSLHINPPTANTPFYWLRIAAVLAAAVGVSLLSRYLIELPALRLRRFVLRHPKADAETAHPPLPLAQM